MVKPGTFSRHIAYNASGMDGHMKLFLTILLLITTFIGVMGISAMFNFSPLLFLLTSTAAGAIVGLVTGLMEE